MHSCVNEMGVIDLPMHHSHVKASKVEWRRQLVYRPAHVKHADMHLHLYLSDFRPRSDLCLLMVPLLPGLQVWEGGKPVIASTGAYPISTHSCHHILPVSQHHIPPHMEPMPLCFSHTNFRGFARAARQISKNSGCYCCPNST